MKSIFKRIGFAAVLFAAAAMVFGFTPAKSIESSKAERIVVLSPSDAEILYAIGAGNAVIARTDYCDYPAAITSLPSVGGYSASSISVEAVAAMNPDLVVGSAGQHDSVLAALSALGIKTYSASSNSIEEVYVTIEGLGEATGYVEEADELVAKMQAEIAAVAASHAGKATPTVYYEVWNAPYMTCGSSSFINEIISAAGGKNLFGDMAEGYPMISEEEIIARNPDAILLPRSNGANTSDISSRAGWESTSAAANGHVFVVNDDLYSRPGPRIVEAIRDLSDLLFAE